MKTLFIALALLLTAPFRGECSEASDSLAPLELQSTSRVLLLGSSTEEPLCSLRDQSDLWGELANRVAPHLIHDLRGKPLSEARGPYDAVIVFGGDELLNQWGVGKGGRPPFDLAKILTPSGKGLLFVSQGFLGYASRPFTEELRSPAELEKNGLKVIRASPYRMRHTFGSLEALKGWIHDHVFVHSTVSPAEMGSYLQRYVEFAALGEPLPQDAPIVYMNIEWAIHFTRELPQ